jgi:hypothetical protein
MVVFVFHYYFLMAATAERVRDGQVKGGARSSSERYS